MEQLILHIRYLLRHHDCVILPGIGAFLNLRREACVDSAGGFVIPASREICFNSSITHNDGLIASSIARRDCVTYEEALRRLDSYIAELRQSLVSDGEADLGETGILHMSADGLLSFEQRFNASALAEYLGYTPVRIPTRSDQAAQASTSRIFRTDKYYYIAVNKTFAKAAAVFVGLMVVCLSLFLPFSGDSRMPQQLASVVPIEKVIPQPAPEPAMAATQPSSHPRLLKESDCPSAYYLIVGSFRTLAEAESFIGEDAGMEIIEGKTLYKVSAASSDDRAEVVDAMRSPELKKRYSQSWIWASR